MAELSTGAEQKVLELKRAYINSFPAKIQQLEICWQNIQASQFAKNELIALRTACHKLAGSSGSYEFLEISNAAQRLEQLLDRSCSTEKFSQDIEAGVDIESAFLDLKRLLQQQS